MGKKKKNKRKQRTAEDKQLLGQASKEATRMEYYLRKYHGDFDLAYSALLDRDGVRHLAAEK